MQKQDQVDIPNFSSTINEQESARRAGTYIGQVAPKGSDGGGGGGEETGLHLSYDGVEERGRS